MRTQSLIIMSAIASLLAACATRPPTTPSSLSSRTPFAPESRKAASQRLTRATWQQVHGWQDDLLIGATDALRRNCMQLATLPNWRRACAAAQQLDELNPHATRQFFEQYFTPFQLANSDGSVNGLVTGYYEPLLHGARSRRPPYLYPLYRWPASVRAGTTLPARAELRRGGMLNGLELVWVDDPVEAFFVQVQGSGRIVLDDGEIMNIGFAGTNGQPYRSIGQWLIEHGELSPAQATMQGIKSWARANPQRVESLLDKNPRFVFFRATPANAKMSPSGRSEGPIGALGVPLTPQRSIAVDPAAIPLGMPVFLSTTQPTTNTPLNRLVFAQDIGGAIKGDVRADFFWGQGDNAGELAGKMKQAGRMWLLVPNS